MSSLKLIAQNCKTKIITVLKERINNPENVTAGCLGLFIQSRWLIFYLECVGGCAITEMCLRVPFPSVIVNDSAYVTTMKKIHWHHRKE